jgi:DNA-binding IclR family transcriptional regulator
VSQSIERFIREHVPTVVHLDVLLCLRQHADQWWSAEAIATRLGVPPHAADATLVDLCSNGLLSVNVGTNLSYRFSPASHALEQTVEEFVAAFQEHRARVYELVITGSRAGA